MTSEEFNYQFKIPKDRVAVVIGKEGQIKKEIEQETHSHIDIDSKEGDVTVSGTDTLGLYTAREIVKAIGRGFNPEVARILLKQDYVLDILQMRDYIGKSTSKMLRLKGRVIGEEGKTRKLVEEFTQTDICVYGKTISIIGSPEKVAIARRAIESLLGGATHSSVYKWLEKQRKKISMGELEKDVDIKDEYKKYVE
ncbi:KH domain-containing protein [Nanoarchaeota archaeon]